MTRARTLPSAPSHALVMYQSELGACRSHRSGGGDDGRGSIARAMRPIAERYLRAMPPLCRRSSHANCPGPVAMDFDFRDLTNMNIGPLGLPIKPSTLPATLRTLQGVVRPRFTRWGSLAFSLAILAAVAFQLRSIDFITLTTLVPTSALFWLAFAASYLATPVSEWAIFRGLWRLPVVGLLPLLHKRRSPAR